MLTSVNAGEFLGRSRTVRALRARADRLVEQLAQEPPTFRDDRGVMIARLRAEFGDVELFRPLLSLREAVRFARWALEIREQVRQSSRRAKAS